MQLRRCAVLYLESREELDIDWRKLFSGSDGLHASMRWIALAPHLDREVEVDAHELVLLGAASQTVWTDQAHYEESYGIAAVKRLLDLGLLVSDQPEHAAHRERDETLRAQHWQPLNLTAHTFSRWRGMRVDSGMQFPSFQSLVDAYGTPPLPAVTRGDESRAIALPSAAGGTLDEVLLQRYTGRNFDPQAVLPLEVAARLLQRAFGAQGEREMAPGSNVLKKTSPSAGGLHPTEAYVLVQRVAGLAPGLYHYHPTRHALDPLPGGAMEEQACADLLLEAVADQDWFVPAPMAVFLSARVERNYWKYRNHAKAYRAVLLDAGHLSQTFYLLATEAGLAAFVTAAINEVALEKALGLDPLRDMVVAVCGCGLAGAEQGMVELRV